MHPDEELMFTPEGRKFLLDRESWCGKVRELMTEEGTYQELVTARKIPWSQAAIDGYAAQLEALYAAMPKDPRS
ncbi:hypothetical protein [Streptomyces gobiensis]|uniref:hypothetical protein n=1 Tax=Streptomyces gobiensis TaxID=2875706 RepID=UPI001E478509|nr:hypothetical protein [Streptomyces gobiensis]UGY94047.1 hypothetical protein test1122_21575 [Streptomyces gobiensis]